MSWLLIYIKYVGLAKRENPELADKPLPHDQSYYEYELSGILVHTGTADTGHYYSFIRVSLYILSFLVVMVTNRFLAT